LIKKTKTKQ